MPSDYDRDCPRCGSETEVHDEFSVPYRTCTDGDCPWEVAISGGASL